MRDLALAAPLRAQTLAVKDPVLREIWSEGMERSRVEPLAQVRENAVLMAMLAYLAAEDPERVPRAQRTVFPVNPETGEMGQWPTCTAPERSSAEER